MGTAYSGYEAKYPLNYDHSQLTGPYVIQKLYELTGGDAIVSTDVGQHQMWAAQYFKFKEPRTFLTSGGLVPWVTALAQQSEQRWAARTKPW